MKKLNLMLISITLGLAACSTSGSVYDDVYYSRSGQSEPATSSDNNLATAAPAKNYTAATVKVVTITITKLIMRKMQLKQLVVIKLNRYMKPQKRLLKLMHHLYHN